MPESSGADGCGREKRLHLQVATRQPAALTPLFDLAVKDRVLLCSDWKQSLGKVYEARCAEKSPASVLPHAMPQAERIGR
jgi:hypothetical protein